eukprot:1766617-Prymnesium_polylepis.1
MPAPHCAAERGSGSPSMARSRSPLSNRSLSLGCVSNGKPLPSSRSRKSPRDPPSARCRRSASVCCCCSAWRSRASGSAGGALACGCGGALACGCGGASSPLPARSGGPSKGGASKGSASASSSRKLECSSRSRAAAAGPQHSVCKP